MLGSNRARRAAACSILVVAFTGCGGDQFTSTAHGDGGPASGGASGNGGASGGRGGANAGGNTGGTAGRGGASGNSNAGGSAAGGASGAGGGGDGSSGSGGAGGASAGTITLELKIAGTKTYCDNVGGGCGIPLSVTHIFVTDAANNPISMSSSLCSVDCKTCVMLPCPGGGGPGIPGGPCGYSTPFSDAVVRWDGAYTAQSTCGANVACTETRYAAPGSYTAKMCATPGHMETTDAGVDTCVNTGPQECVDVPFDYPGSGTVTGALGS